MTTVKSAAAAPGSDASGPGGPAGRRPPSRGWGGGSAADLVQRHGALVVLILVLAVAALTFDGFLSVGNLNHIAVGAAFPAIIALGMTFVIITGGIDLSVGTVFALAGVLAAWASQYGSLAALALPLVVCALIGLLNGVLIAVARLAPFIVTLATMLGAWGLMLAVSDEGTETYVVPDGLAITPLVQDRIFGIGYPVFLVIVLFAVGGVLLRRTGWGQNVYAVGGNEDAAALLGVPVVRTKVAAYTLSGLLAGLAGALNAVWLGSGVTIFGIGIELDAISAVVIGGTLLAGGYGFVSGSLVGVLLLESIQNIINAISGLSSAYQQVVSGSFLIVVVLAQNYLSRRKRRR
ncbi:ABC transporter permease [Streptomonospora litoralis]|uniref:Inner membrane ABC transporter permease protein YjfF n=1 Tax=Streptomonospora litoralis TaxID=2498135 RepID=A0A4P6QAL2_9ACTN|nr:ABC transporter permease [Streptomonospora litoralis]QBI56317.1 Inner membrane ABC transporter permease protein YjfF [Streptomonospora litoralis]